MSDSLVSKDRAGTVDTRAEDSGKFPFDAWEFTSPTNASPYVKLKDAWKLKVHDLDIGGDAAIVGTLFSRFSCSVKTDDYTITDTDGLTGVVMNNAAAKTITLPTLADNQGRILAIVNKGAGEAVLDGEGAETIQGFATLYIATGSYFVVIAEATEWKRIAGPLQPVAGEPSLGTPHHHAPTDDDYVYTNTTPSANTWYDVDLTSILTAGITKAAFITLYIATDDCSVYFAKANTETIGVRCNYGRWDNAPTARQVLVPINDSGHVYIAVSSATSDIYIEKLCFPVS